MQIVIIGLSITSSWGNGHATIFRGLTKALHRRGHEVTFLERNVPWYADNRDLPDPRHAETFLYDDLDALRTQHFRLVREADLVMVGSYVPEGVAVGQWVNSVANGVTAFYDIDTPVTLAKLREGDYEYIDEDLIRRYDLYLSFTGGPTLEILEQTYQSPCARPLYCCVDPDLYQHQPQAHRWTLGYMGTYSDDRQPTVDALLVEPARQRPGDQFVVAGPQYPEAIDWPANVQRIEHLPPAKHCAFYNQQRMTLNVTRAEMIRMGYAPSVRLFEASACGAAIVSDWWEGLDTFFEPDKEILIARSSTEMLDLLNRVDEERCRAIGAAAKRRVLAEHTADHRAAEIEQHVRALAGINVSS